MNTYFEYRVHYTHVCSLFYIKKKKSSFSHSHITSHKKKLYFHNIYEYVTLFVFIENENVKKLYSFFVFKSNKAVFESTENQFRKSFSVKSMRLAATENRFSGKSFLFDQNFTLLTRKSFYIVVLPSNDFRKKHKRERESHRKKKPTRTKHTQHERERTIGVDCDRDHRNYANRRWSRSRSTLRAIAISRSRSARLRSRSHRENVIFSGFYLCF